MLKYFKEKQLNTLLKYPGGKTGDLKHIRSKFIDLFPKKINNYFEPFLGGGAAWLSIDVNGKTYVNDFSKDLMNFYNCIQFQNSDFYNYIDEISKSWITLKEISYKCSKEIYNNNLKSLDKNENNISSLVGDKNYLKYIKKKVLIKLKHIKKLEEKYNNKLISEELINNIEGALKGGYYLYLRDLYNSHKDKDNSPLKAALFYFLRDYSFSSMFRFNKNGEFNVPYGGISYNKRSPAARVNYWKSIEVIDHMKKTTFFNDDFEVFFKKHKPKKQDFIFVDPPYDSEFSTYDQNVFNYDDQKRLANYLINETNSQFMAVMKNTEFIYNLYSSYESKNIHYKIFDKNYTVSFKNRNEKGVEHIVVYRINN